MERARYWKCQNCGQVVQGFNAMEQIDCCSKKNMVEINGPAYGPGPGQDSPNWDEHEEVEGFPVS